ncbi:uncharacterized protein G2W53_010652 [Senna tora]|uniref:Uncharacterized protein n=1 Tax=Senna tora TaxID=362788 RepID=A0A834X037_9FABA|nr:uncharacterized protein G2W53_010652 [Senna tora]
MMKGVRDARQCVKSWSMFFEIARRNIWMRLVVCKEKAAFEAYAKLNHSNKYEERLISLEPPPQGWLKVNVDGSMNSNLIRGSSCGGVARD